MKANKAEKRPRSDSNQIETPEPKRTNQGNKMSGNPGSAPPPVPPPGPPPGLPPVPPAGPQQNPQIYVKEISINKPPIFTGATNRARKWLADVQVYLMLKQTVYNNNEKRILFVLSYIQFIDYNIGLSKVEKWADL